MSVDAVGVTSPTTSARSTTVRRLVAADVIAYRNLMLEAYEVHVDAFTSSAAEREALPMSWWERRLRTGPDADEIVIGALEDDTLAGVVGLSFEPREKAKHKATLFGMSPARSHRTCGERRHYSRAGGTAKRCAWPGCITRSMAPTAYTVRSSRMSADR